MDIKIRYLKMNNFKKQQNTDIAFSERMEIMGDNETGKTSIYDAWLWLLFDRDSRGNKGAAAAKTTDGANFVHHMDHEVEAGIEIDDEPYTLRKVLREKWVRPKGKEDSRYDGNTVQIWKDDVEMTVTQYQDWLNALCPLSLMQCLTDLKYFSIDLSWRDRLSYLMDMSGGLSDYDVAAGDPDLELLLEDAKGTDLTEFKKKQQAKIAMINKTIDAIPTRISEQKRSLVTEDWVALEAALADLNIELAEIEARQTDLAKAYEPYLAMQKQLVSLQSQRKATIDKLVEDGNKQRSDMVTKIYQLSREKTSIEGKIWDGRQNSGRIINEINRLSKENDGIREDALKIIRLLKEIRTEEFQEPQDDFLCPTCHQRLPENDINSKVEQLRENWKVEHDREISHLESRLESIKATGRENAARIESLQKETNEVDDDVVKLEVVVTDLTCQIDKLREDMAATASVTEDDCKNDPAVVRTDAEIRKIEADLSTPPTSDNSLKEQKANVQKQIDSIKTRLYARETSKKAMDRIAELEAQLKTESAAKALLERQVYQCDRFVRARTAKMESKINGMFHDVTFKLFKELINGSIEECCEAVVNGTTFHDANTAGQINAGLDIINTMQNFFEIRLPVFVDNVNLVTRPRQMQSQQINLTVVKDSPLDVRDM